MATGAVRVEGLSDLNRALRRTSKDVRLGVRKELRQVAEPVRRDAESLSTARISNLGHDWSRMRVGVITDLVYVAPKQRGVKGRGQQQRRRPNLATRLMDDAMQPALERHRAEIERDIGHTVDRIVDNFSR